MRFLKRWLSVGILATATLMAQTKWHHRYAEVNGVKLHYVEQGKGEADLFLVVGKRIDYRLALGGTRLFPAEAKFIQIDIHPQELWMNRALDAAICGDARAALDGIADAGAVRGE